MTAAQYSVVFDLVKRLIKRGVREWRHGDCVGSDAQAHAIVLRHGGRVVKHPSDLEKKRAWCAGAAEVLPPKPPLERNHDMVAVGHLLVAAPKTAEEELRSGTWATVRYARRRGLTILIVLPNGTVRREAGTWEEE